MRTYKTPRLIGRPSCCYACGGHLSNWNQGQAFGGSCDDCKIQYRGEWEHDGPTHQWARTIPNLGNPTR